MNETLLSPLKTLLAPSLHIKKRFESTDRASIISNFLVFPRQCNLLPCLLKELENDNDADAGGGSDVFSSSGNIICFLVFSKNQKMMMMMLMPVIVVSQFFSFFGNTICFLIDVLTSSGNIICFLVFSKNQKMDLKPSFINILRCLAVFDTLFLVNLFFFFLQFRQELYCKSLFWFEIYFFKVFLLQHISICAMFVNTPLGTIKVSTGIYYVQCDQL